MASIHDQVAQSVDAIHRCGDPAATHFMSTVLHRYFVDGDDSFSVSKIFTSVCENRITGAPAQTLALLIATFVKKNIPKNFRKDPDGTLLKMHAILNDMLRLLQTPTVPRPILRAAADVAAVHLLLTSPRLVTDLLVSSFPDESKLQIALSAVALLSDPHVPFGPICRSSQRLALQKRCDVFVAWLEDGEPLAMLCEFLTTSVVDSVQRICPLFLETVHQSNVWKSLLHALASGHTKAVHPVCAVCRLMEDMDSTSLDLATEALRAAHQSNLPHVVATILNSLADCASSIVVHFSTSDCANVMSQCMSDVVHYFEAGASDPDAAISLCSFLLMLANALTPSPPLPFEEGDDEDEFATLMEDITAENHLKSIAASSLETFFRWVSAVLFQRLRIVPLSEAKSIEAWWFLEAAEERHFNLNFEEEAQAVFACVERLHRAGYLEKCDGPLSLITVACIQRYDLVDRENLHTLGLDSAALLLALRRALECHIEQVDFLLQLVSEALMQNPPISAVGAKKWVIQFFAISPSLPLRSEIGQWLLQPPLDCDEENALSLSVLVADGRLPTQALQSLLHGTDSVVSLIGSCCAAAVSCESRLPAFLDAAQRFVQVLGEAFPIEVSARCRDFLTTALRSVIKETVDAPSAVLEALSAITLHDTALAATMLYEILCSNAAGAEQVYCRCLSIADDSPTRSVEGIAELLSAGRAGLSHNSTEWFVMKSHTVVLGLDRLYPTLQRLALDNILRGLGGCKPPFSSRVWIELMPLLVLAFSRLSEVSEDENDILERISEHLSTLLVSLSPIPTRLVTNDPRLDTLLAHLLRSDVDMLEWKSLLRDYRSAVGCSL